MARGLDDALRAQVRGVATIDSLPVLVTGFAPKLPVIPGREFAGVVSAVGPG